MNMPQPTALPHHPSKVTVTTAKAISARLQLRESQPRTRDWPEGRKVPNSSRRLCIASSTRIRGAGTPTIGRTWASEEELEQIAQHYGVSSMVIEHQLRNHLIAPAA